MKKELVCSVVILLILISLSTAVEITFSKDSYQPQELLQAEIIGNFISLNADNINIYKNEKAHAEPVVKGLTKYNNVYYFYALVPAQEGNYSLRIENAEYFERGVIKNNPLDFNITLLYKNTSDISVNPGFIIPEQDKKDFSIKVKSLYKNPMIKAVFEATGETKEISLLESEEQALTFSLPELSPGKSQLTINNYKIPVFLLKKGTTTQISQIEFIPYEIKDSFNQNYAVQIIIKNTGVKNLTNIQLTTSLPTTFSPETIAVLEVNAIKIVNLTFAIEKINQNISGNVEARAGNETFFLPVFLTYNKTTIVNDTLPIQKPSSFACSQIGNLCLENQRCNGESVESLDGPCCIGDCIEEETSSYSNIVGIILVILLILIVLYAGYKIVKRRKLKNADELLEEKTNRFERRLKGEEVRGKLDRV